MQEARNFIDAFFLAVREKRLDDICMAYQQSPQTYVILEGPRLATLGYEKIAEGWGDFCRSAIQLEGIEWLEEPFFFNFSDSITLAGVLRLYGQVAGGPAFDQTFRATFLLHKSDYGLKIVHEHVSGALSDPYGIGDWKRSQSN
jgi:ketosteroid isomerase-like protein